jgi:hypothetical protein
MASAWYVPLKLKKLWISPSQLFTCSFLQSYSESFSNVLITSKKFNHYDRIILCSNRSIYLYGICTA